MSGHEIEHISAVISYVEEHLNERLDLDTVAKAAGYSKYHLHRMFTHTAGLTLHGYIQRRRLTEAAKLLTNSEKPVIEIALDAGYESRQAFTTVFKSMYKKTPAEYRQRGNFYPLQWKFAPEADAPGNPAAWEISYAVQEDLSGWMKFAALVAGGFPCLEEPSHLEQVKRHIRQKQALVMRNGGVIIGAAAFSRRTGSIDFLAAHPQCRRYGAVEALLGFLRRNPLAGQEISITTFREGDKADTGQRVEYKRMGFAEAELLTEFGYPTQRLVLPPEKGRGRNG